MGSIAIQIRLAVTPTYFILSTSNLNCNYGSESLIRPIYQYPTLLKAPPGGNRKSLFLHKQVNSAHRFCPTNFKLATDQRDAMLMLSCAPQVSTSNGVAVVASESFSPFSLLAISTLTNCHAHILHPINFILAGHDDGSVLNVSMY